MKTTITLQALFQKLNIQGPIEQVNYPIMPILDLPFFLDESKTGISSLIDGRKRILQLISLAKQNLIPWNLELTVYIYDIKKIIRQDPTSDITKIYPGILNPEYIRDYILYKKDPNSETTLTPELLEYFVHEIMRHLLNSMKSNHTRPYEIMVLAAKLSSFLQQNEIAYLLQRSEGWVSGALAVSKLPIQYLEALENNEISYSAALTIAAAETPEEQKLLYELADVLSVHALENTQKYLRANPSLATKTYAKKKILKIFARKVVEVDKKAKIQFDTGIIRSFNKFFRSRLKIKNKEKNIPESGKDPQSLVFRLKIVLDGEYSENLHKFNPVDVEKIRDSILKSIKYSLQS